jgi:cardiolipin synthase
VLDSLPTARENIYTVPNMLTVSRLIAAPFVGYCILHDHHAWALGLFAYAGITDLLDGWMARRWNMKTVVGTVIDPMADKTLMTVLTITLAIKGGLPSESLFPFTEAPRVVVPQRWSRRLPPPSSS